MPNGAHQPHLADGTALERWAIHRSAQADLPRLIRRLIRHENDQIQRVEMRGGEGVGLPGYDGMVEATRATSFVPDGLSVWEMGTDDDPADKATKDYNKPTKTRSGSIWPPPPSCSSPAALAKKEGLGNRSGEKRENGATYECSTPMT